VVDITERRHAEERFRMAVESAPNAMVMVGAGGKIVLVNAQTEKVFGYTREELIDQSIEILVPERFRGTHPGFRAGFFAQPHARAMGTGSALYGLRKDGTEIPVEIGLNPIETDEGSFVLAAIVDVTERERAQRALAQKNEEIEAFVYIVSHDLRAPLVNLQGFSKELATSCRELKEHLIGRSGPAAGDPRVEDILDREIPDALRYISASTSKFERLINALLGLSRSGRQEYRYEELDIRRLVGGTLDSLQQLIQRSGASVEIGHLPRAWGDPTAVGQVFSNLIANALAYLEPGRPGRIELGGEEQDRYSHYWIRDNGLGIPATARTRVFQVFQRFHPDVSTGEGMGLAIIKRIVERHGGRVWIESEEGQGSTFHLTLPTRELTEG
jgi:PAS domain S-box-containing protein